MKDLSGASDGKTKCLIQPCLVQTWKVLANIGLFIGRRRPHKQQVQETDVSVCIILNGKKDWKANWSNFLAYLFFCLILLLVVCCCCCCFGLVFLTLKKKKCKKYPNRIAYFPPCYFHRCLISRLPCHFQIKRKRPYLPRRGAAGAEGIVYY